MNFNLLDVEKFIVDYAAKQKRMVDGKLVLYGNSWLNNCISAAREVLLDNLRRDPDHVNLDEKKFAVRTANISSCVKLYKGKLQAEKEEMFMDTSYFEESHTAHFKIVKYCWFSFKLQARGLFNSTRWSIPW